MAEQVSPEFRLIAACCIWPPSERRNQAIRFASDCLLDWDKFLRVIKRQRVAALVCDGLKRAGIDVRQDIKLAIQDLALHSQRQNLLFLAEAVRLQKAFDEARVPVRFVKGVALAQIVYGGLSVRHCRDIDFLVNPEDVPIALDILDQAGYRRETPPEDCSKEEFECWRSIVKECEHVHQELGVHAELHWQLLDNPYLVHGPFPATTKTIMIAEQYPMRTLADDELFFYLCLHGAGHAWSRLKWLVDIGALLEGKSIDENRALYHRAEVMGAGRCVAQAMLLCHRILGTPIPDELLAGFQTKTVLRLLEALALDMMAGAGGDTELDERVLGSTRVLLSHFLLGTGFVFLKEQFRYISRTMSLVNMETTRRFPSSLHFPVCLLLWGYRRLKNRGKSPIKCPSYPRPTIAADVQ